MHHQLIIDHVMYSATTQTLCSIYTYEALLTMLIIMYTITK